MSTGKAAKNRKVKSGFFCHFVFQTLLSFHRKREIRENTSIRNTRLILQQKKTIRNSTKCEELEIKNSVNRFNNHDNHDALLKRQKR